MTPAEITPAPIAASPEAREIRPPWDDQLTLRIPPHELATDPEISIVVPALNEESSIAEFIDWCRVGIERAGVRGEIIIIDSSTDRTGEIALANGARVLKSPKRGLGRAYIDAIPFIRGRYVLMGDADCTYDFRSIAPFVEKFRQGYDFVIGSRFAGHIEDGAMPALHRYFGTPLTSALLNLIYGSSFSDIHCGMRGMSLAALRAMKLQSQSWEYASEIIVKSIRLGLRSTEVPIDFHKDRDGRLSHHRRAGWTSPWIAGWMNLRSMLVGGADFFLIKPGMVLFGLGLATLLALCNGPVVVGKATLSLNAMLLGLTLAVVGLQAFLLGGVARTLYDLLGEQRRRWMAAFGFTRTLLFSTVAFGAGFWLASDFLKRYVSANYTVVPSAVPADRRAVFGLFLIIAAFQATTAMLLIHGVAGFAPLAADRPVTDEARDAAGAPCSTVSQ